jgi:hypothetical protein
VPDRAGAVGSHCSRGGGRQDPRRGCLACVCVCVFARDRQGFVSVVLCGSTVFGCSAVLACTSFLRSKPNK